MKLRNDCSKYFSALKAIRSRSYGHLLNYFEGRGNMALSGAQLNARGISDVIADKEHNEVGYLGGETGKTLH
jgi:hypothetical protein